MPDDPSLEDYLKSIPSELHESANGFYLLAQTVPQEGKIRDAYVEFAETIYERIRSQLATGRPPQHAMGILLPAEADEKHWTSYVKQMGKVLELIRPKLLHRTGPRVEIVKKFHQSFGAYILGTDGDLSRYHHEESLFEDVLKMYS